MKFGEPLVFPEKLLAEYAEQVVDHWPDPNHGTYLERAAWLCLDYVSLFSYILEQIRFFDCLADALYYIQNPNKFCREYKMYYDACEAWEDQQALLKIAESITNE